ncbi:hypothetical protein AGMMS49992_30710 [Clostridia bacterium]|nr:hypothetical protein AGMMS49992_30710 [Clostridia bacterium]
MPKAIGCGRTHKCGDDVNYPNLRLSEDASHPILAGQLDGCSLPGRPPHTITCVHALGITPRAHPVGTGNVCSDDVNISVDGYDLVLHAEIPLELIVRDCCGYQYCLRSYFYEDIRIPLCVRADPVRASSDYLFLKVRVRLCSPYSVPADVSANASHVGTCTPVPATGQGIPVGANGMRLEVLVEACVVKLVPYGVLGFDPYSCQPPKYN